MRTHHRFLQHNLRVRDELERLEAKLRTRSLYAGDDAVAQWYSARIPEVTSVHELNKAIKQHGGDRFLELNIRDMLTTERVPPADLPDTLDIGGKLYPLSYRFDPGQPDDGIEVCVPAEQMAAIHTHAFEWALPALWPERIASLLACLPRQLRKKFVPLPRSAETIAAHMTYAARSFVDEVRTVACRMYRVDVPPDAFADYEPDPSLWVRVSVIDHDKKQLYCYTPPNRPPASRAERHGSQTAAHDAFADWFRDGLIEWDFDELPRRLEMHPSGGGLPVFGFPALEAGDDEVAVVVVSDPETAVRTHAKGVRKLAELALATELAWELRDAVVDAATAMTLAPYAQKRTLNERARALLCSHATASIDANVRTKQAFLREVERVRKELRGMGANVNRLFGNVADRFTAARALLKTRSRRSLGGMAALSEELRNELDRYLRDLLEGDIPLSLLLQYPRYLTAFGRRIESAADEPVKYRERRAMLSTYEQRLATLAQRDLDRTVYLALRELLEEYAVSLYAQQAVGTRMPVSEKRLNQAFDRAEYPAP